MNGIVEEVIMKNLWTEVKWRMNLIFTHLSLHTLDTFWVNQYSIGCLSHDIKEVNLKEME